MKDSLQIRQLTKSLAFCIALWLCIGFVFYLFDSVSRSSYSQFDASWNSNTPLLVVSNVYTENIEWLRRCIHPVAVCRKHDDLSTGDLQHTTCDTPNVGREASAYLNFIIRHYDNLPRYVAFLHGHETAWHQKEDVLSRLNTFSADTCPKDYVSLNRHWMDWIQEGKDTPDMKRDDKLGYIDVWPIWFERELGPPPTRESYFQHDCCAQFIVSRRAILRHPKQSYEKWLRFVSDPNENKWRTILFEHLWHIIFGEPRIVREDNYYKDFERCFSKPKDC